MDNKKYYILTINPGSTSTKIGVYENEEEIFKTTVRHSNNMLEKYSRIWDQYSFRKDEITQVLKKENIELNNMDAIVARGGLIRPIASGVYNIDENMIEDARKGYQGQHASNLGCVIAYGIAWEFGIPSYIVDPPAVDELDLFARFSGTAEFDRNSLFHALNIFATARIFAADVNKKIENLNLIIAHLGGGITVAALEKGRAVNVNNGLGEGPFSPERSGGLPLMQFIDLCFDGKHTKQQVKKIVAGKGGLVSYFGTNNATDVENMAKAGNKNFETVYGAMGYQIAEEIGARATNLKGKVDAIILTGGIAFSDMLTDWIKERVAFISPVKVYPGENELKALASGGLRVLRGEERAKSYSIKDKKIAILCWNKVDLYDNAFEIIKNVFVENGYILSGPDKNLEIKFDNCENNEDVLRENIEKYEETGVDIIFSIGTPSSVRAFRHIKSQIPFMSVGIYSPLILGIVDNAPQKNIFASCYSVRFKDQFENTIYKFNSEINKIGVIYQSGEIQSEIQLDEIKKFCQKKDIEIFPYNLSDKEFKDSPEYFKKNKAQWVIITADTSISEISKKNLSKLTDIIPTMCVLQKTIQNGGFIGYIHPWEDVCRKGAIDALQILEDRKIKAGLYTTENKVLFVNKSTAKKLKLYDAVIENIPYAEMI